MLQFVAIILNDMKNRLFTFKQFPLSVCTQDGPLTDSEELIEAYIDEDETGLISFLPYVDPAKIYISQHNSSIGETWRMHNDEFAKYLLKTNETSFIDIGGGSGNIFKSACNYNSNLAWKIIDLNPTLDDSRVETVTGFYEPEMINEDDVVITSHFLEHQYNTEEFLVGLRKRNPKYHIFSLPNFKQYSKNRYSATIMFEHPHYLTEDYLDYILAKAGWKIVDKHYYKDHSIFFTTVPIEPVDNFKTFNCYDEINDFIQYMIERSNTLANRTKRFYVFGAHFTYYYLLNMGVSVDQIIAVVDNDPKKQGRRMYGTNTPVISPAELQVGSDILVEMGPYNDEIKKTLNGMNFI